MRSWCWPSVLRLCSCRSLVPPRRGVFYVKKDPAYLRELFTAVHAAERVAIVGGGFIGVEFAEEIAQIPGKQVSIVESVLPGAGV